MILSFSVFRVSHCEDTLGKYVFPGGKPSVPFKSFVEDAGCTFDAFNAAVNEFLNNL